MFLPQKKFVLQHNHTPTKNSGMLTLFLCLFLPETFGAAVK